MSERDVFIAALQIEDPAGRSAYLDGACGPDGELRRRVEELLQAFGQAGSFLQQPAADATSDLCPAEGPGTLVGPYKLLQQIGEGGMGTVFLAEQTQPVQRKVALKVIKPGMDSRQVVARFEAERQALALMDHASIARVFDGGTTESGLPYFVMELVKGVPITRYCDDNRLSPRERLELFVPVCQAIQHAHQKGIIHRDVKPSNVMVTLYDGRPVPKVIDFGVAKATEQRLTERTLFTQYGAVVGTLEYMSPEQAEMSALGVDTRSDVYSLGVLLYELLTGSTPLGRQRIKEAAFGEVLRMIKEEEPPRPSARLSGSGEELASISAQRHMEPGKLTKLVRGELDWIVMKSLEKDRNRRYETANGFAMDLQRYLADEPVLACPPSAGYRLRKFARRNKGPVTAACLVALALVVAVIGTTWGMLRATDAETLAVHEAKQKELALGDRTRALAAARASEQKAVESLKDALAAVDEMLTRVAAERLANVPQMAPIRRELLQEALKFYQKFLQRKSDDPVIRRETALAYWRMARIQHELGQSAQAKVGYARAIAMFTELDAESRLEAPVRSELIGIHLEFSWVHGALGNSKECEKNVRRAFQIAEDLVKDFPQDLCYSLLLANAGNSLFAQIAYTRPDEAKTMLRRNLTRLSGLIAQSRPKEAETMPSRKLILMNQSRIIGEIHTRLGNVSAAQGRNTEAEKDYREALKHKEKSASEHPDAVWLQGAWAAALQDLARIVAANGRPQEAEELQGRAIPILDRLATDHSTGPHYRSSLAGAHIVHAGHLKNLNRTDEVVAAYRRALAVYDKLAADFRTVPAYQQLAFSYRLTLVQHLIEVGRLQEAQQVYGEASALPEKLAADIPTRLKHWQALVHTHIGLARLLTEAGKKPEAEAAFRQLLAVLAKLEAEHGGKPEYRLDLARSHHNAGSLLKVAGRPQEAEKLFRRNFALSLKLLADFPDRKDCRDHLFESCFALAHFLNETGRPNEVERPYFEIVTLCEKLADKFPTAPEHRASALYIRLHLCHMLMAAGRPHDAVTASKKLMDEFPLEPQYRILHADARGSGGIAYAALEQWDKAAADFAEAARLKAEDPLLRYWLALVQLRRGETDKYRAACAGMIERFGRSANPEAAYWTSWTCALAPHSVADWRPVVQLAEKALAADPKGFDKLTHFGAVLYRAGRFAEAARHLTEAENVFKGTKAPRSSIVYNWLFLAMAEHRLGHPADARKWLEKAVQQIDQPAPVKPPTAALPWNRQLTVQLLRREAEELLKPASGVENHDLEKKQKPD